MENKLHYNNSFDDMDDDYIQNGKRNDCHKKIQKPFLKHSTANPKPNKDERNELAFYSWNEFMINTDLVSKIGGLN